MPQGRRHRQIVAGSIDQRDAGAAPAEIAHRDDPPGRYARVGPHGAERRRGVRQQRQRPRTIRPFGHPTQRRGQRVHRLGPPVGRIGDRHVFGQRPPASGRIGERTQAVGNQGFTAVHRAVGRDDSDRVTHPVHEVADDQAGLVQPRVLRRHPDLGRTLAIQREHGLASDGVISGYCRQIRGTNR